MPRRRNFSGEFKAKVVLDLISGSKSVAELCREHELKPDLLSTIPNHPGDMPEGTLRAILKQAGITPEEFLEK